MPVESAADRLAFAADFGVTVSWSVGGATAVDFLAVFDNAGFDQQVGDGADAQNAEGSITFAAELLPAGAGQGDDAVTVDGTDYTVKDLKPDGTGMLTARLEVNL